MAGHVKVAQQIKQWAVTGVAQLFTRVFTQVSAGLPTQRPTGWTALSAP